jgi:hypothetical protein
MQGVPTYTFIELGVLIPKADIEKLKLITGTLKNERHLYQTLTMTKILLAISKRTLELGRQIR